MKSQVSGARYMSVLGLLLSLALLGAAIVVATSDREPAAGDGASSLLLVQNTLLQADQALSGNARAFDSLARSADRLRALDTTAFSTERKNSLAGLAGALSAIGNGRDALATVNAVADDLDELIAGLTERVYVFQGALTLQQQPSTAAQLERLRLLGEGLRRDARSLALGAGDSAELTQQLHDGEMAIAQIVRGFQGGDPELGLQPVSDPGAADALAAVGDTVSVIGDKVRDILAVSDRFVAIDEARRQLAAAAPVFAVGPDRLPVGASPAGMSRNKQLLAALLAAALLLFGAMAWIYYRSADMRRATDLQAEHTERNQQAIMRLLDELSNLADGDLTVTATVTEDITGAIADSINFAIEALRELVMTVNDSAITVDQAARQTDNTAQRLTTASDALSKQVQSASQAIAGIAASIEEVSGNAERSSDVARHSVDVAHKGGDAVRRTIEGMNTIRETIQETSKRIKRLGESSQEIGDIIELINDIADQTNILALNASIQASMAGEAGRGFAVVADEVQRLAERSANATKQIEVLVRTIQADTNEAMISMERSTTDVVGGALLAENAGAALEEIEQVSNQIALLVQNISGSAKEQAAVTDAATKDMDMLMEINAQTVSGTSETTESIRKLASLAAQLRESVAGFRLPEARGDRESQPGPKEPGTPGEQQADESEEGDVEQDAGSASDDVPYADQQTA